MPRTDDQPRLMPDPPPVGTDEGVCQSCRARILWGRTAAGAKVPLDPKPETRLVQQPGGQFVQVHAYVNHFVTCPTADQHKRPAAKPEA